MVALGRHTNTPGIVSMSRILDTYLISGNSDSNIILEEPEYYDIIKDIKEYVMDSIIDEEIINGIHTIKYGTLENITAISYNNILVISTYVRFNSIPYKVPNIEQESNLEWKRGYDSYGACFIINSLYGLSGIELRLRLQHLIYKGIIRVAHQ